MRRHAEKQIDAPAVFPSNNTFPARFLDKPAETSPCTQMVGTTTQKKGTMANSNKVEGIAGISRLAGPSAKVGGNLTRSVKKATFAVFLPSLQMCCHPQL